MELILPGKEIFLKENRFAIDERMYYAYKANINLTKEAIYPGKSLLGEETKVILGGRGCGKTTVLKREIDNYKAATPGCIYIYVDLSAINTTTELLQGIMAQIKSQDPGFFVDRQEEIEKVIIYSKNQPLKLIMYYILCNNRPTIIMLDEFDKLFYFGGAAFKKYLLSGLIEVSKHEIIEQYRLQGKEVPKPQYLLFLLTNKSNYTDLLEPDINNRMLGPPIRFHSYRTEDLKEIMKKTAEVCFHPEFFQKGEGVWLDIVADFVSRECESDSRAALKIMSILFEKYYIRQLHNEFISSSEITSSTVELAINDYERELSTKELLQYDNDRKLLIYDIASRKINNTNALFSLINLKSSYDIYCGRLRSSPKKEGIIYKIITEFERKSIIEKVGSFKNRKYKPGNAMDMKKATLIKDLIGFDLRLDESASYKSAI